MLTDIFSDRYAGIELWQSFSEPDRRFLVQGFRMVNEQLYPYWVSGKESCSAKIKWKAIHDKLSMELGLSELSPKTYSYQSTFNGKPITQSGVWTLDYICKTFVCAKFDSSLSADQFMKDRISFIELAFREREEEIAELNLSLPSRLAEAKKQQLRPRPSRGIRLPGSRVDGLIAMNKSLNKSFQGSVDELNNRLRRANYNLNYHNGFIQISDDELVEEQIEKEFWNITKNPLWENVDIDMKEAIDLRDSNGRDPSFYATRALESAIKIVSGKKGWTHGGEKGAHNFIDNLAGKKNGSFITAWEKEALKSFFTHVRNPLGHGPGSKDMPELSVPQTNWAIETCMSWVKTLVKRL